MISNKYNIEIKPLVEITKEALKVLFKEIGVVDTVRFINQFTAGHGDYTEERQQWISELTLDEIIADIKQKQNDASHRD